VRGGLTYMPVMTMKQTSIEQILFRPESTGQSDPIRMFCRIFVCVHRLLLLFRVYTRASASISASRCIPLKMKSVLMKKKEKKIFKNKGKRKREQFAQKERVCVELYASERGDWKRQEIGRMVAEREWTIDELTLLL
jgi:hypothetical protein